MLLFYQCVLYCIGVFADTTIPPTSHALFLSGIREYWDLEFLSNISSQLSKVAKYSGRKKFKLLIVSTWPLGLEKAQFPSQYVQNCYKNPMKALSSASVVGRIGNDKVSDICGQLLPIFPLFLVVDGPSFPWLQQLSGRSQKRNEAIVLVTSSNLHVSKQITTFYIRARWIGPSEQKMPKIKTGMVQKQSLLPKVPIF